MVIHYFVYYPVACYPEARPDGLPVFVGIMTTVYVAGPYSKGDVSMNVRNAVMLGNSLRALGFTPFIPHLTHFWHLLIPHEYEYWLKYDEEWLKKCDIVLRMDGESSGADREVETAKKLGIPVVYSLSELLETVGRIK